MSRCNPDILWSHNDSGDLPALYAIDTHGHYLGKIDILNARAFDWEDIAVFEMHGKPYLLIADTGDNFSIRPTVSLYVLPEPDLRHAYFISERPPTELATVPLKPGHN